MIAGLHEGPSYSGYSPLFFAVLPPERPQKGRHTASLKSVPCFLLPFSFPTSSPHSSFSLDER